MGTVIIDPEETKNILYQMPPYQDVLMKLPPMPFNLMNEQTYRTWHILYLADVNAMDQLEKICYVANRFQFTQLATHFLKYLLSLQKFEFELKKKCIPVC